MQSRLGLVYAAGFFALSTESLIGMLLPLLAVHLRLPSSQLGLVVAAGSVGSLLLALPAGALCDHFGDRRLLIAMALGGVVTSLCYPIAGAVAGLCLVQFFGGLFRSNIWVAAQSYGVRVVDAAQRQRFTGRFSFWASIGMLVAPLLAGYVVYRYGIAAGFVFMGLWASAVGIVALLLPEPSRGPVRQSGWQSARRSYAAAWPLLLRPMILLPMILTLLRLAGAAMTASFYPVHLDGVGFNAFQIGLLITLINVGNSLGSLLAAPLAARLGSKRVLFGSIAIGTAAMAVIPAFSGVWPIGFFTFVHGVFLGVSLPMLLTDLARHSNADERGLVLALRSVFNRAGYLVAPLALGLLAQTYDLLVAFLVTGAGVVVCLGICYRLLDHQPESR